MCDTGMSLHMLKRDLLTVQQLVDGVQQAGVGDPSATFEIILTIPTPVLPPTTFSGTVDAVHRIRTDLITIIRNLSQCLQHSGELGRLIGGLGKMTVLG